MTVIKDFSVHTPAPSCAHYEVSFRVLIRGGRNCSVVCARAVVARCDLATGPMSAIKRAGLTEERLNVALAIWRQTIFVKLISPAGQSTFKWHGLRRWMSYLVKSSFRVWLGAE